MEAKSGSPNYERFVQEHGNRAVELDALNVPDLQQILRESIEAVIDRDAYDRQVAIANQNAGKTGGIRRLDGCFCG